MAQNLGEVFTEQGFAARTIHVFANGPRFKKSKPKITPEMWDMQVRLIADLKRISELHGEMHTQPEAWEWFSNWYENEHEKTKIDHHLRHYHTRKPVHLWKLATLISISNSDSLVITARDFITALQQLDSIEPLMLRAFANVGRNPIANRTLMIFEDIRMSDKGEMFKSAIIAAHTSDLSAQQIDEALQTLILMKKIVPIATNSGGDILYRLTGKQS
jgi:hypothetical protein